MRYKRIVGEWKDITSDFYANDFSNHNLESGI